MGKSFRNDGGRAGLVFVDPYISTRLELGPLELLGALLFSALHLGTWLRVKKRFRHSMLWAAGKNRLRRLLYSAIFVRTYGRIFPLSELRAAEFVTHIVKIGSAGEGGDADGALLSLAEGLVRKYAGAGLVVTSRLHCALPCLAVGTPVLFADGERLGACGKDARFGGLIGLLNVAQIRGTRAAECPDFPIRNKDDWKPIAERLEEACETFAGGT